MKTTSNHQYKFLLFGQKQMFHQGKFLHKILYPNMHTIMKYLGMLIRTFGYYYRGLMCLNIVVCIDYRLGQPKVAAKLDTERHKCDCVDLHKFVIHFSLHMLRHIFDWYTHHTSHQFMDTLLHIVFQYLNQKRVDWKDIDLHNISISHLPNYQQRNQSLIHIVLYHYERNNQMDILSNTYYYQSIQKFIK